MRDCSVSVSLTRAFRPALPKTPQNKIDKPLDSELVKKIMRWDMAVLQESPWYQEILREGEKRGEERGLQIGEERGLRAGIELALEIKFGIPGLELMPIISQIHDLQRLKAIQQAIKIANTVAELQQVLYSK
ncbi:hypothetical protein Cal7507_4843 [Calothrix sp. PCC 7507]|nr:hypothetical protein Cal7507_4843 [Calothrix sp. PCC 7507]